MIGAMYRMRMSTMKLAYNTNKTENEGETDQVLLRRIGHAGARIKKRKGTKKQNRVQFSIKNFRVVMFSLKKNS